MIEGSSIESLFGLDGWPELDFEETWGDPLDSEYTDLEEVPDYAVIDFGNGVERESSVTFLIKMAMLDPEATVYPQDEP
jgi:hypothetical protein